MSPKEQLRERILKAAPDPMAVLFWFDTLYHRHEQNPEFTHEKIYEMLVGGEVNAADEEASRAFMDGLTASDEQHRRVMRGVTPEIAAQKLQSTYGLTAEQAKEAQHLRDNEGISEDEAVKAVRRVD